MKPISDFNKRQRAFDGLQSRCRACSREWYLTNRDEHKANTLRRNTRRRREIKELLALHLVGKACLDWGETDIRVLEFDHVDPTTKLGDVAWMISQGWSWQRIVEELEKCVVRCANCHRRKEARTRMLWRHRWLLDHGLIQE